ncbi:DUF2232 domain-containing protein [Rhizobiaceae bacterium n13]|uniref:DUF2232 domain-containing protein n=1 Tax=Ferirhizobium litorale TaxID=2927786 RepID=A0AAE3QDA2_9HYPH|nr:DUF2232 domain-containing protein [Fererhizobium litorale]MDI7861096.1 DUF2232 domain-containing protein [Fererhizobium litorale]MDI7921243.1 DUF2232 domain-containing protein [Fererhizobium litorale]
MRILDPKSLLTGVLAGITAALLVLGASVHMSFFAAFLYAASAMPVLIVGLGWGVPSAIVAIATAAVVGAASVSPMFALAMTLVTLAPAGWLSRLANLARPASEIGGPDDLLAWYPLSDILMHLCALVAISVVIIGYLIGYGPELTNQMVDVMMTSLQTQEPSFVTDPAAIEQTKQLLVLVLPMTQGALWVILLFAAYYLAARIVTASGRNFRPREDMPSALRMNRNAIFIFLGGLLACFFGGVPAMIGAVACGTFGAGFLLAGFAALHYRSRGKSWRVPVLILAYLSATMLFPAFFILVLGLADTRRAIALTPVKKPENASTTNS